LAGSSEPARVVLVDTVSAAVAVDRPRGTIRRWASQGLLERKGTDGGGRALYDLAAVYAVSVRFPKRKGKK
jgi:hypothetical protein